MEQSGKSKQISERQARRHQFLFRFLIRAIRGFMMRRFAYTYAPVPENDTPYIVVCNHNNDLDPALLGLATGHAYFVASDHIMRNKAAAFLLDFVFAPILRRKATIAASTVIEMRRRLAAGYNVALFAEGERSYDGNTAPIHPTMGKLVKNCNTTLVTYRLSGGYLTSPRWAFKRRVGKMTGELRGIYTREDLAKLSPDEVHQLIQRDISEDAYASQALNTVAYVGKKLAEGLDTALYRCPVCASYGTLAAAEDDIYCSCGFRSRLDAYGYFSDPAPRTFTRWYRSQRDALRSLLAAGEALPFSDDVELLTVPERREIVVGSGRLRLTKEHLSVGILDFPLAKIQMLGMYGRNHLVFACGSTYYELRGTKTFNARYYLHIFDYFKGNEVRR